jgi:hypothetical protein
VQRSNQPQKGGGASHEGQEANELIASLREAAEIAEGKRAPAAVHHVPIARDVDVRAVRAATGLSRAEFACRFALDPRAPSGFCASAKKGAYCLNGAFARLTIVRECFPF